MCVCLQGTSRGGADLKEIVRRIDLWGLTHLYVVGGNGGNAAANAINQELQAADVICSVIGVPKSIDNDILLVSTSGLVIKFYMANPCDVPSLFSSSALLCPPHLLLYLLTLLFLLVSPPPPVTKALSNCVVLQCNQLEAQYLGMQDV